MRKEREHDVPRESLGPHQDVVACVELPERVQSHGCAGWWCVFHVYMTPVEIGDSMGSPVEIGAASS